MYIMLYTVCVCSLIASYLTRYCLSLSLEKSRMSHRLDPVLAIGCGRHSLSLWRTLSMTRQPASYGSKVGTYRRTSMSRLAPKNIPWSYSQTHKNETYGDNFESFSPLFPLKMGAYHTIDLQLNQKFTLAKEHWDFVALDRLGMGPRAIFYSHSSIFPSTL